MKDHKTPEQLEAEADRLLAESAPKMPYKTMSTKVSMDQARIFSAINEKDGVSDYMVMQMLIDAYIRLKDPGHVISPELNKLRIAFDLGVHVQDCLRLSDPSTDVEVMEATYYLGDKGHKVMRPCHIFPPVLGRSECTQNSQDILERLMQEFPVLYEKLQRAMRKMRVSSVYELLCNVAEEADSIDDANEIEESFADVRKNDYGREMTDGPYRRTMVNSMDAYERRLEAFERRQTEIDFGDDIINEIY